MRLIKLVFRRRRRRRRRRRIFFFFFFLFPESSSYLCMEKKKKMKKQKQIRFDHQCFFFFLHNVFLKRDDRILPKISREKYLKRAHPRNTAGLKPPSLNHMLNKKLPLQLPALLGKMINIKSFWKEKKRLCVRLRSGNKHHLRKSADRKAQIRKAFLPLTELQTFPGGVYPPSATSRTISFSFSNSFWY